MLSQAVQRFQENDLVLFSGLIDVLKDHTKVWTNVEAVISLYLSNPRPATASFYRGNRKSQTSLEWIKPWIWIKP